jgi:hypothetical protein
MIALACTLAIATGSCIDQERPVAPRLEPPVPAVDLGLSDGCARFQVRFDAGGQPLIETVYGTSHCPAGEIKLLSDTVGSFNAATGALRVPVVMENVGTVALIPRVRLRFNADSVVRYDSAGNVLGGTSDIVGYLPDSASANGRVAYWWYDQVLAPSGQPQVLLPGARTQRRWMELRGTTWAYRIRMKLLASGVQQPAVPAVAPDSEPRALMTAAHIVRPPNGQGFDFFRDLLVVRFKLGTALAERTAAISSVAGNVVGGFLDPTSEGGAYLIKLPSDSTQATLIAAEASLRARASVKHIRRHLLLPLGPTYLRPTDGQGWTRQSWRPRGDSLLLPNTLLDSWAIQYVRAPLAWGCSTGDTTSRVGMIDLGFSAPGVSDLPTALDPVSWTLS